MTEPTEAARIRHPVSTHDVEMIRRFNEWWQPSCSDEEVGRWWRQQLSSRWREPDWKDQGQ